VAIPESQGRNGLRLRVVSPRAAESHRVTPLRLLRVQKNSGADYPLVLGEPDPRP